MKFKAPGKAFRKELSLIEVMRMFPDNETAGKWFINVRWGNGMTCPRCGSDNIQAKATHKTMPHRCRKCRKFFSVRTGTVMQGSNLDYQTWAMAIYLMTTNLKSMSSMKLHRDLEITQKSAWHLAHRIRETYADTNPGLFDGPVEVDETYIGGIERNKHQKDKLNAGRGSVGKLPVVGIKDRETNQVRATPVENTKKPTLQGFIQDNAKPDSTKFTDNNSADNGLPYRVAVHHRAKEYVRGDAHTNGIESFWSMFKRAHKGTFHKMSLKHLNKYVTEFSGKHNMSEENTMDQLRLIARGMLAKRLTYKQLIADNGLDSGARS